MTLFSKRYTRALAEPRLSVSLPRRLRSRAWMEMERRNETFSYQPDPSDRWLEHSHLLAELEVDLKREYGEESLMGHGENDEPEPCDLEGFVQRGPAPLDVIDLYSEMLGQLGSPEKKLGLANRRLRCRTLYSSSIWQKGPTLQFRCLFGVI